MDIKKPCIFARGHYTYYFILFNWRATLNDEITPTILSSSPSRVTTLQNAWSGRRRLGQRCLCGTRASGGPPGRRRLGQRSLPDGQPGRRRLGRCSLPGAWGKGWRAGRRQCGRRSQHSVLVRGGSPQLGLTWRWPAWASPSRALVYRRRSSPSTGRRGSAARRTRTRETRRMARPTSCCCLHRRRA